ncbi:MAG: hypothetical protein GY893_04755, partial [bacterium]|nr:hypothetical protein [bacterium]
IAFESQNILDSTTVGRELITAADEAAARAAIGVDLSKFAYLDSDNTWTGDNDFTQGITATNGDFSGNLTSEVGGSYKLYQLGTEGDTDTSYLELSNNGNNFEFYTRATGAGTEKNISIGNADTRLAFNPAGQILLRAGGGYVMSVGANAVAFYEDLLPQSGYTVPIGRSTNRFSAVYSVDGSFTGNLTSEVGGSYKLFNLGDESAADSEYLEISASSNVYKIAPLRAGTGAVRQFALEGCYGSGFGRISFDTYGFLNLAFGSNPVLSIRSDGAELLDDLYPNVTKVDTLLLGKSNARWSDVYSVDGSFSGNLTSEVGGSYKLFNLGDASAADSEFLTLETDSNNYRILSSLTGAGVQRDIRIGGYVGTAYRGIRIQPAFGGIQFIYNNANRLSISSTTTQISTATTKTSNFQPNADNTYTNGTNSIRWSDVYSVDGNFTGKMTLSGLPTSDPGVAGELWNDSGTVKISI